MEIHIKTSPSPLIEICSISTTPTSILTIPRSRLWPAPVSIRRWFDPQTVSAGLPRSAAEATATAPLPPEDPHIFGRPFDLAGEAGADSENTRPEGLREWGG